MKQYDEKRFDSFPIYDNIDHELVIEDKCTKFTIWSPEATAAKVSLYDCPLGGKPQRIYKMEKGEHGTWQIIVDELLYGLYYTFSVKYKGHWLSESPGIWAKAIGTNGKRGAIIDLASTNPQGWDGDHGPKLLNITDAVIYEMHLRDFSAHRSSGLKHKGKFLSLTQHNAHTRQGELTGIDHLKELGITHVHILPSFDFCSVDEEHPEKSQYNWGYDPANYNAPEGSYSTNPFDPTSRIKEMKLMIKALHDAGIGIVMDVVYNHTATAADSNFSLTAPEYFYRHLSNGSYSNASGCGNETASERNMMRLYMIKSVTYWAKEYHIDGFRFDLMGIHDIDTMNEIAYQLHKINPSIILYGEGWTAGPSTLPYCQRATKENVDRLLGIAVFNDVLRDGIKGSVYDPIGRGFATGDAGHEEAVKNGIIGTNRPCQTINYVSCHDNLSLTDKLRSSLPDWSEDERKRAALLAQTIVMTSQGVPFIFAGEEVFRDKKGVANSYKSPDSVNDIDWRLKHKNRQHFDYYASLIRLRKEHPAFHISTAEEIRKHLKFDNIEISNVISYSLIDNANGDNLKEIKIVFNGNNSAINIHIPEVRWIVLAYDGILKTTGMGSMMGGDISVPPISALILAIE